MHALVREKDTFCKGYKIKSNAIRSLTKMDFGLRWDDGEATP